MSEQEEASKEPERAEVYRVDAGLVGAVLVDSAPAYGMIGVVSVSVHQGDRCLRVPLNRSDARRLSRMLLAAEKDAAATYDRALADQQIQQAEAAFAGLGPIPEA